MDTLQTEFEFTLPRGYVDGEGNLHKQGTMRLATAMDEIEPLRDPRVTGNEAYLVIILLARVVTALGTLRQITPHEIENMFTGDLAYLQRLYRQVNEQGSTIVAATCPSCSENVEVDLSSLGG